MRERANSLRPSLREPAAVVRPGPGRAAAAQGPRQQAQRRQLQALCGEVLQPMLVNLGDSAAENMAAHRLRQAAPLEHREGRYGDLIEGEVLHISGHADASSLAGRSPQKLAGEIAAGLPRSLKTLRIQLHGCETSGYAVQLQAQLKALRPQLEVLEVKGVPGFSAVTEEGDTYSIGLRQGDEPLWDRIKFSVNANPTREVLERQRERLPVLIDQLRAEAADLGAKAQRKAAAIEEERLGLEAVRAQIGEDAYRMRLGFIQSDEKELQAWSVSAAVKALRAWQPDNAGIALVNVLRSTDQVLERLAAGEQAEQAEQAAAAAAEMDALMAEFERLEQQMQAQAATLGALLQPARRQPVGAALPAPRLPPADLQIEQPVELDLDIDLDGLQAELDLLRDAAK